MAKLSFKSERETTPPWKKKAEGSPEGWNKRILSSNSKLYKEMKISVKVNIWITINDSVIVTTNYNYTFYFFTWFEIFHHKKREPSWTVGGNVS